MTVIDAQVHRSAAQNARMGFFVAAVVVTILAATIISAYLHPILALLLGAVVGGVCACVVWALMRVWPVLRVLWWWTPEILLSLTIVYGWLWLSQHTNLIGRLLVLVLVVGIPAGVPPIRRRIVAIGWCVAVRHRLRVCFSQFIITNRSGSLPLILLARPTPVGERVWIYLRPGLSLKQLADRADTISVACAASAVVAESASTSNAAYVRLDIKRRDALRAMVGTPLAAFFQRLGVPVTDRTPGPVPTALDLSDITDEDVTDAPSNGSRPTSVRTKSPASPDRSAEPVRSAASATGNADDDDWI